MKIAIHQPEHLPYLGFMYKMSQCDIFVLLDDVQFQKNGFQNRNRIKTSQGAQWVTVPVLHSFGQKINEVRIDNKSDWKRKHLQSIQANYAQAPYFKKYFPLLQEIYSRPWNELCELNITLIQFFTQELGIKEKIVRSSSLIKTGEKNELLISICKNLNATSYLSGMGAAYLDVTLFLKNKIEVEYTIFKHPEYPQGYTPFLSNMSTLDLLMNCGPLSGNILRGSSP
ncbi:MAG TPA: WbqC family protein [Candidatus Nanoarchaeia archaeon]|nr:WbqC family protein [Candidatus Nanoarchaeia archaeon]